MAEFTVRVSGYREFVRACNRAADRDIPKGVREAGKRAGEVVRADAERRFAAYNARSAAGYRVRVRVGGIFVEQSLRKTTGKHPEYGALQMRRALIPAADENQEATVAAYERELDEIEAKFGTD